MKYKYREGEYKFKRYPETGNRSLRAWSAADEYVLQYIEGREFRSGEIMICNDRFGFLHSHLYDFQPIQVVNNRSQKKAHILNLRHNNFQVVEESFITPLSKVETKISFGIIQVPKSLDLFRLYLDQLSSVLQSDGEVICSFMTRNFSPQLIQIASEYYENVEQSRAWKKSRIMILSGRKSAEKKTLIHKMDFNEKKSFEQYYGVFSASNIDYASQFFMEEMRVKDTDQQVLDLASGNGVLAWAVQEKNPECHIHLVDDSWLAVESSRLNLSEENTYFYWNNCLEDFENGIFDLVVSNPPFHFEYEIDVSVALGLFKEVRRCLKPEGRFQLVANNHLNYKVHLEKIFGQVELLAVNKKFVVYNCKP